MFEKALYSRTNAKIFLDTPMKKHTTLGVGGVAKYFIEPDSLFSLNETISLCKEYKVSYKVIGAGSNLLVSDLGFNGAIISTLKLSDVFFKVDEIRAMAGARLDKLIKFATDNGLSGLEALSGIPASVGGAVVMNAGAFGHTISDYITEVETLADGKIKKYYKENCGFGYRKSKFKSAKETVVSACFKLEKKEKETVINSIKAYLDIRKSIQPSGRSCGSVFLNPKGDRAGRLIDKADLKGITFGGATVSNKHANFITTTGLATATDVYHLISHVKEKVKEKFNVELIEEVEYIGEF